MALLLMAKRIAAGTLVVPTRDLSRFLTDRIGNIDELTPYLDFWRGYGKPCHQCGKTAIENGVLEIVVIEYDATSMKVPRIPKGTDGRAKR